MLAPLCQLTWPRAALTSTVPLAQKQAAGCSRGEPWLARLSQGEEVAAGWLPGHLLPKACVGSLAVHGPSAPAGPSGWPLTLPSIPGEASAERQRSSTEGVQPPPSPPFSLADLFVLSVLVLYALTLFIMLHPVGSIDWALEVRSREALLLPLGPPGPPWPPEGSPGDASGALLWGTGRAVAGTPTGIRLALWQGKGRAFLPHHCPPLKRFPESPWQPRWGSAAGPCAGAPGWPSGSG